MTPRGESPRDGSRSEPKPLVGAEAGLPVGNVVWWLSPIGALCLVTVPMLLLAWRLPDTTYRAEWDVPKALTGATVWLLFVGVLVLAIGVLSAQLGSRGLRFPTVTDTMASRTGVVREVSSWLFWLTIVGYVAMALAGIARGVTPGGLITAVTSGETYSGTLRSQFAPVTGITTLTQVGIAYVVVGSILIRFRSDGRARRRVVIVLLLGLMRSFLLNERLAILELAVPVVAVMAAGWMQSGGWRRVVTRSAPALLLPAVVGVFGAFEYFRSWTFYSTRTDTSILTFMLNRFAGYYVTAFNNGQLTLDYALFPGRLPFDSLKAFWSAPGVETLGLYQKLSGRQDVDQIFTSVLSQHGNPEFNNPGGLVAPFADFGSFGGLVALLVCGFVIGKLYRSSSSDGMAGALFYPVVTTGLFELPRYLYWSDGRVTPALLALGVLLWRVGRPVAVQPASTPLQTVTQ